MSCCLLSAGGYRLVVGYVMSSASVDAVPDSGGSRVTNVARTVAIVVGRFATWKVYCI